VRAPDAAAPQRSAEARAQAERSLRDAGVSEGGIRFLMAQQERRWLEARRIYAEIEPFELTWNTAVNADQIDPARVGALMRQGAEFRRRMDEMQMRGIEEDLAGLSPADRKAYLQSIGVLRRPPLPGGWPRPVAPPAPPAPPAPRR
jgi:hypothetical protein